MHSGELSVLLSFTFNKSAWNLLLDDIISDYSFNVHKTYLVPAVLEEANFCYILIHV